VMHLASPPHQPTQAVYPFFLVDQLPTILSGFSIAGFFAIAQGSMDSAINALASSAVADIYLPLRRRFGRADHPEQSRSTPKIAVALMGAAMTLLGIACVFMYDGKNRTLIDFALGVLSFAFTGMLGVFCTALFTRRGNTVSVIAALIAGLVTVILLQPSILAAWSTHLLRHPFQLASTWWMPIGTIIAFAVCLLGKRERDATK